LTEGAANRDYKNLAHQRAQGGSQSGTSENEDDDSDDMAIDLGGGLPEFPMSGVNLDMDNEEGGTTVNN